MKPRGVLITGTTSGLGRALLEHYVGQGARVVSVNRRRVAELESSHPSVRFECVDVRFRGGVDELMCGLADSGDLPEVVLLNAGINRIDNDESFDLAAYADVVDTNLYGALNFVAPLTRIPRGEVVRHVVAISSLAHYAGSPYGLGYRTSKRALTTSFDVWAKMYRNTDLVFQQVLLGPVRTAIHTVDEQLPGWVRRARRLLSASPERVARAIARFAETREPKLFYPPRAILMPLGMLLGQSLMPGVLQGRSTLDGSSRRGGAKR